MTEALGVHRLGGVGFVRRAGGMCSSGHSVPKGAANLGIEDVPPHQTGVAKSSKRTDRP